MVHTLGVVGAGQMGGGIAQVAAQAGLTVRVFDPHPQAWGRAHDTIAKSLGKLFEKGKLTEHPPAILARLSPAASLADLSNCDVVVEAASENEEIKKEIFQNLCAQLKPQGIIATNTSSLPITRLAQSTKRPEQVIGMHFMNPVPVMELVEVIRGHRTSDATYNLIVDLAQRLGKKTICSQDYPGFIVNRVLMPMINEAFYALMEGVASAEDIDTGMKLGTNQPMGPLALADFIGLDTCYAIMKVLHEGLGDSKYRPCPLLRKYVDAGHWGRKVGQGVYAYGTR